MPDTGSGSASSLRSRSASSSASAAPAPGARTANSSPPRRAARAAGRTARAMRSAASRSSSSPGSWPSVSLSSLKPSRSHSSSAADPPALACGREPAHQRAPIGESGQVVGQSLAPGQREVAQLVERQHAAHGHGGERRAGEADGERAGVRPVVGDEQQGRVRRAGQRHRRGAPQARPRARLGLLRLPGGEREREEGERPRALEDRARAVGIAGAAPGDEVGDVAGEHQHRAGAEPAPRGRGPPAGEGERAERHADEHQVEDRVGEGRDDLADAAVHRAEHRVDQDGGERQRAGDAVEPDRGLAADQQRAREQREAGVHEHVAGEPARHRGTLERRQVEDVPDGPGADPGGDRAPGGAALGLPAHARGDRPDGEQLRADARDRPGERESRDGAGQDHRRGSPQPSAQRRGRPARTGDRQHDREIGPQAARLNAAVR
jgi:hypothetical protein